MTGSHAPVPLSGLVPSRRPRTHGGRSLRFAQGPESAAAPPPPRPPGAHGQADGFPRRTRTSRRRSCPGEVTRAPMKPPAAMEMNIRIDMPLPMPRSVTSSPSHMTTQVPAVIVMTMTMVVKIDRFGTIWLATWQPWNRAPVRASSLQLLTVVIPKLENLKKEGQSGTAKITQYTRYLTVALAILQGTGLVATARTGGPVQGCQVRQPDRPEPVDLHHHRHGHHDDRGYLRRHVARLSSSLTAASATACRS